MLSELVGGITFADRDRRQAGIEILCYAVTVVAMDRWFDVLDNLLDL
jgi:hypothetical protein